MKKSLFINLVEYLRENNPDILFSFQDDGSLISYIKQKINSVDGLIHELKEQHRPDYIIEELCMDALTADLRPSKYQYIRRLLEEEFSEEYQQMLGTGLLRFEIMNLISNCNPLFEVFGFSEEIEEDRNFRYTVIGTIKEYFEQSERENRVSWPTMPIVN